MEQIRPQPQTPERGQTENESRLTAIASEQIERAVNAAHRFLNETEQIKRHIGRDTGTDERSQRVVARCIERLDRLDQDIANGEAMLLHLLDERCQRVRCSGIRSLGPNSSAAKIRVTGRRP